MQYGHRVWVRVAIKDVLFHACWTSEGSVEARVGRLVVGKAGVLQITDVLVDL